MRMPEQRTWENMTVGYATSDSEVKSREGHTWSTLGWPPSRALAGGSLLMKLPSSTGNCVKGCGGPRATGAAGGACGSGPGPGPLWCGPGAAGGGPGARGKGPGPGAPCNGLGCCAWAGLLHCTGPCSRIHLVSMSKPNITGCGKVLVARLQMNHPGRTLFSLAQLTDMAAHRHGSHSLSCVYLPQSRSSQQQSLANTAVSGNSQRGHSCSCECPTSYHVSSIGEAPDWGSCPLLGP